jgi:isoprenylcysteine carboxyl methyltransferase (ICMT) family protein YpbQ
MSWNNRAYMTLQDPGERPSLVRSGVSKVSIRKLVKIRFLITAELEQAYNVRVVSIVPSAELKQSIQFRSLIRPKSLVRTHQDIDHPHR